MIFSIKPTTHSIFVQSNTHPEEKGILSNYTHSCISVYPENTINPHVWFSSFHCCTLEKESLGALIRFVKELEELTEKKMLIVHHGVGISKSITLCKFLLTLFNKHDRILSKFDVYDRELADWLIKTHE